jgi:hypothetical protein
MGFCQRIFDAGGWGRAVGSGWRRVLVGVLTLHGVSPGQEPEGNARRHDCCAAGWFGGRGSVGARFGCLFFTLHGVSPGGVAARAGGSVDGCPLTHGLGAGSHVARGPPGQEPEGMLAVWGCGVHRTGGAGATLAGQRRGAASSSWARVATIHAWTWPTQAAGGWVEPGTDWCMGFCHAAFAGARHERRLCSVRSVATGHGGWCAHAVTVSGVEGLPWRLCRRSRVCVKACARRSFPAWMRAGRNIREYS